MLKKTLMAAVVAAFIAVFAASTAFAGEITGNGKYKGTNGKSPCSFSGQEDQQWYYDDEQKMPKPADKVVKGDPAHSQNWGHVKQAAGLTGGAGPNGCNPNLPPPVEG